MYECHLFQNDDNCQGRTNDYSERNEESKDKQEDIVTEMLHIFPGWSTTHSILHDDVFAPDFSGRWDAVEDAKHPGGYGQDQGEASGAD